MKHFLSLVALAILGAIIITMGFVYYLPIQDPYFPPNIGWNGCSEIAEMYRNVTVLAYNYDTLPAGEGSLLAIIGPTAGFSPYDATKITEFLINGGTVLLADNFGTGNQLLVALNVNIRISEKPLADLYFYSKTPQFPVISDFSESSLTANLTAILLNHPSYLSVSDPRSIVLAHSSPFSFIDYDKGQPMSNETQSSYPIMAATGIGKGTLVTISDPNVFTNQMLNTFDNMRLFQNLMDGKSHLILDVVHLSSAPLTSIRIQMREQLNSTLSSLYGTQTGILLQWATLSIIILGFSAAISLRLRRPRTFTENRDHAWVVMTAMETK